MMMNNRTLRVSSLVHVILVVAFLTPLVTKCSCLSSSPSSHSSSSFSPLPPPLPPLTADSLSSPERYAQILNMTIEQVSKQKNLHRKASEDLHRQLTNDEVHNHLTGKEKHNLLCRHRLKYGRHPFVCKNCWCYNPTCVCNLVDESKMTKKKKSKEEKEGLLLSSSSTTTTSSTTKFVVEVIVWCHHREWGLTSNTGCILGLTIPNCQLLMKGLPEHDKILMDIIQDTNCIPIVLWPSTTTNNNNQSSSSSKKQQQHTTISLETIQKKIQQQQEQQEQQTHNNNNKQERIVLIAVDGTWRNARRMVSKLSTKRVKRLDLSEDVVFSYLNNNNNNNHDDGSISDVSDCNNKEEQQQQQKRTSLLAPLRSRGLSNNKNSSSSSSDNNDDDGNNDTNNKRQVCTAEAVVGALISLGIIDQCHGNHVLDITRTKIDRIYRYRGKVTGI